MHALEFVAQTPWLITEEGLQLVMAIAQRQNDIDPRELEVLATKRGRYLEGAHRVQMRDGTAIIPVMGPIFRYANMFTAISGATSTQLLALDIRTALDDSDVESIVLDIDSPGGAAQGIHELGELIYDARGTKPIIAYSGGQIASAAYWVGAAADEIVLDRIGIAGSIGAKASIQDATARDAKTGVRTIQIVSSVSPDKVLDITQDEGRAKVQKIVDDLAGVFVEVVARNRGVTVETVLTDYGRGGEIVGQGAVEAGLVDRLGSLESVLTELKAAHVGSNRRVFFMTTATKGKTAKGPITVRSTDELRTALENGHSADEITLGSTVDVEALKAETRTEVTAELEDKHQAALTTARAEATTAERKRVTDLQAIAVKGYEDVVAKAITEGSAVEATAVTIAKAQRTRGSVTTLQNDAPAPVAHGGKPGEALQGASSGWGKITARTNERINRKAAGKR